MATPETLDAVRRICDRLTERRATLFLGAGVNADVKNDKGEECPLVTVHTLGSSVGVF